jgi:hypothetical protein
MHEGEGEPDDLYGGEILPDADVMYIRSESGQIMSKANNLWMTVQWCPPNSHPTLAGFLRGEKIAEMIHDPVDKARFEELSKSLRNIASWELKGDDRWKAITSEEANRVYVELYQIARRNGVSNNQLIR